MEDIADALGLTPQAIYYRLRDEGSHPTKRGRRRAANRS